MKQFTAVIISSLLLGNLPGIGFHRAWANPKAQPNPSGSLSRQASLPNTGLTGVLGIIQAQSLFNPLKYENVTLKLPGQGVQTYRVPILDPRVSPSLEIPSLQEVEGIQEQFSKINKNKELPSEGIRDQSNGAWERKKIENGGELWLPVQASAAKAEQDPALEQQSNSDRTEKAPPQPEAAMDAAKQRAYFNTVNHDLRAPLSVITTVLGMIQGRGRQLSPEQNQLLERAVFQANHMANMINNLLDLQKIQEGKMTINSVPASAIKMAREAVESLQPLADKKQLDLTAKAEQNLPEVLADPMQTVHRILGNLIFNAIKFTPAGGSIEVQAAPSQDSPDFVTFSVQDTGPGMTKEEQEKLFKPYSQGEAGKYQPIGTGLGLSNAKALVELQNGRIWVESEPGKGTKFSFTLPVSKDKTEAK